ncbi:EFR1 family ferrodoxin [Erysipelotrichaceae bacterium RD49]|nr:EFR1 family ferrodoxin [Erysipelotrichaceae bacterium RD49]
MKKVIYYFTGTGNSMRAAIKIAKRLQDTCIVSMRSNPEEVPAADCEVIGFVFPIYRWTMPEPAVRFVEKLQINPKAYIFAVAMPSFILGDGCERLERILETKGAKLSYGAKVNSVANYVLVYPPMPLPKYAVPKAEKKLDQIAQQIAFRKTRAYPKENKFIPKLHQKVMEPYEKLQKDADLPFTISKNCIHCGICARVCPVNNISIVDGKPVFHHKCAQCMACVSFCPQRAIGYDLKQEDIADQIKEFKKVPIAKMMGLPAGRKRYHNPYITAADIAQNERKVDQ